MKWAPVPWKSSDFAPRGISFPEKLCYTTDITVKFLPFCQFGFVSAIPAPPQTSLRRKPSPKALPHKALGGQDHYLHFPVRGRKQLTRPAQPPHSTRLLFTFPLPARGRKRVHTAADASFQFYYYLHFSARGRKPRQVVPLEKLTIIITYISP